MGNGTIDKVGFKDLTGSLKVLVVIGWIVGGILAMTYVVSFIYGIFLGVSGGAV